MDYTITEIIDVKPNAYQDKTSVRFKVSGVEHQLSTLTTTPDMFVENAVIHGTITSKEKEGRTFYNFNLPKSTFQKAGQGFQPSGDLLRLERKVDTIITEIQMMRGVMGDILSKVDKDVPFS